jgi:hypothetical protein
VAGATAHLKQTLRRLNTNGTIGPAFVPESGSYVRNILPAKDGSGGADGTLDRAFGFRPVDGTVKSFTLAEDGSGDIFITGSFIRVPENTIIPPSNP